eukprot:TRINITY_DN737_c0_g1_i1.p1 TRINITY_DN737_c0_g1~~TRINITY_DN737_c0_g1_i1.p1  ORF type:complete len:111 (+),score=11.00 TRINITY_DN737_c0_g1_i1:395-727(+)
MFSTKATLGSSSPAGSFGAAATSMVLMTPLSMIMAKRWQRMVPSTLMGPGWCSSTPKEPVTSPLVSAIKRTIVPSVPWSLAQPFITAPSLTQNTTTSATPLAFSSSAFAR